MLHDTPPVPVVREVAKAVAIAALTAAATGLVNWGIDALKHLVSPKESPKE